MKVNRIKKILDAHNVPNYIIADRIYADSMEIGTQLFQSVEELTGWSKAKIYTWLGY